MMRAARPIRLSVPAHTGAIGVSDAELERDGYRGQRTDSLVAPRLT